MAATIKKLVSEYIKDPADEKFAQRARAALYEHQKQHAKKKANKVDEKGDASVSVWMAKLKKEIMKLGIYDARFPEEFKKLKADFPASKELAEFEKADMIMREKIRRFAAKKYHKSIFDSRISAVHILPKNIQDLKLEKEQAAELIDKREKRLKKKAESLIEVKGDEFLQKILGGLKEDNVHKIVPALLLATGRRMAEILGTGFFTLAPGMRTTGYVAMFHGQLKSTNPNPGAFKIPLLAPFKLIKDALEKLRAKMPSKDMTPEQIHDNLEKTVYNWCVKYTGMNPHKLRAIYAVMCEKLYNAGADKIEFTSYISQILGHEKITSAVAYQRVRLSDFTKAF